MDWYKKAIYTILEKIKMQGDEGFPVSAMTYYELEDAKKEEKVGRIIKVLRQDAKGNFSAYIINKKFDEKAYAHQVLEDSVKRSRNYPH